MNIRAEKGTYYWSNGYAYGTINVEKLEDNFIATVTVLAGESELKIIQFINPNTKKANTIKSRKTVLIKEGKSIVFN